MILKILLFATCGILSVLAVGGKTGAKEGYKISPSGLDALRRVRSTLGKNTPYPVVTRTWGRNLESFCRSGCCLLRPDWPNGNIMLVYAMQQRAEKRHQHR